MPLISESKEISAVLLSSQNSWKLNSDCLNVFGKPELKVFFTEGTTFIRKAGKDIPVKDHPLELIESYTKDGYFALGYIAYDFLEYTDIDVNIRKRDSYRFPDIFFSLYKQENPESKIILSDSLKKFKNLSVPRSISKFQFSKIRAKKYMERVDKILNYIRTGDVYQVNLSQLMSVGHVNDPLESFVRYYIEQPVPYAFYLNCDDFYFLSGSMELFLEKDCNIIRTKPIKGTRKRVLDINKDLQLKNDLCSNLKERAENLMIVDLMRNDLSRICKIGSVNVDKLFDINSYNTLFQMESCVSGVLSDDRSFKDIIYNIFPPGSVTGAPKRRAIQIIDELEDHYRGPYCGCAGVLRPDGGFTLSVTIRTGVIREEKIMYWAGSGIVSDSVPKTEYIETLLKSRAFLHSLF